MQQLHFTHQSYLAPDEAFHFSRVKLDATAPRACHGQDYHEVFWITDGTARHAINGTDDVLGVGQITFIRPGDIHAFQGPCALTNILILPDTVNHLGQRYPEIRGRTFWCAKPLPETWRLDLAQRQTLDDAARDLERGSRGLLAIEAFLMHLLTRVLAPTTDLPSSTPAWLASALRAAQAPEVFSKGAAGLVAAAGRSHPHVSRAMRTYLNTTPSAYMNARRMTYAAQLLSGTDRSLTDIALDCGVENLSHFHKLFRAHHGTSPHQWRKRRQVQMVQPALQDGGGREINLTKE